jgi:hypothetical protein
MLPMLNFAMETNSVTFTGQIIYPWIFGPHSTPVPDSRRRHTHGKRTRPSDKAPVTKYWRSQYGEVLKVQRLLEASIAIDRKVQAWLEFKDLIAQWHAERGATSSITEMAMCDAYLKIIAKGPEIAVPLILAQLRSEGDEPDQWFWALHLLTGIDPVAEEDRGDFVKMSRAWLAWGDTEGYGW